MAQTTYTKHKCRFCDKVISSNGLAKTNHYRMHCRNNDCIELQHIKQNYYIHSPIKNSDIYKHNLHAFRISNWQYKNPNDKLLN